MKKTNNRDTLEFLGEDFQFRLVKAYLDDHTLFKEMLPIIDQNCFTIPELKVLMGFLKDFIERESYVPSYDLMKSYITTIIRNDIELEKIRAMIDKIRDMTSEGVDWVKDQSIKFFKQQNLIKAINQIQNIVKQGDLSRYDESEDIIKKALSYGNKEVIWEGIYDNLEETLSEDHKIWFPTGIKQVDDFLGGGWYKQELVLIAASSGIGKTTISTSFASNFATYKCEANNFKGYKVLQIFFEDRAVSIKRKHFGKLTGVEARNLSKSDFIEYVKETVNNHEDKELIKNNLRIGRFRTGEVNPNQLKQYINNLINSGFKPDAILIDYFECVKNPKTDYGDQWSGEAAKMRQFENWTWDFDSLVIVTTQGTKDSMDGLFTMNKTGGAKQKFEIAHSVLTISKTSKDKEDNMATLYIPKRREGGEGGEKSWSGCQFNNGTCVISADSCVEFGNIEQLEEKQKEDSEKMMNNIMKKELAKKTYTSNSYEENPF